jgi:hypothetical protein
MLNWSIFIKLSADNFNYIAFYLKGMGVNLVPTVRNFRVIEKEFQTKDVDPNADGSIEDGCITPGLHKVLRFDIYCHNKGNTDFVIGNPASLPDIFEPGHPRTHEWIMKEKFYVYVLSNKEGKRFLGYKRPWCLADFNNYNCRKQGIGVNQSDHYHRDLPCQFIIIDEIQDGTYTLTAIANAPSVIAHKKNSEKILFEEDNYEDNCINLNIKIKGNDQPIIIGQMEWICKEDIFSSIQI